MSRPSPVAQKSPPSVAPASRWGRRLLPYILVAPATVLFVVIYIYPVLSMFELSLYDWDFVSPDKEWVGLGNFQELLGDSGFRRVLLNSLLYTVGTVAGSIGLAVLLAWYLSRQRWVQRFVQGVIFTPHIISLVSISFIWMWMMDPSVGLLNWILESVGLGRSEWISSPKTALASLVLVAVWKTVGYDTLILVAAMQTIPRSLYEAAALDKSSAWTTFTRITLPTISPSLFFLLIMNTLASFQVFDMIAIMTTGGPLNSTNTLVYYIYEAGFLYFDTGRSSAAGVILFLIVAVITVFYFYVLGKKVHYQ